MNPTATHLSQLQPAKSPSATDRQQTSAAPDLPFRQILSGEIEHSRNSAQVREAHRAEADSTEAEPNAATASANATETDTTAAMQASQTELSGSERLPSAAAALPPDAQNHAAADAILALAMPFDVLKPAPRGKDSAAAQIAADSAASTTLFDAGRTHQAEGRATRPAALPPGSVAAGFAGQLAAARQSDAMQAGERLPDILNNPSLALAPQASLGGVAQPNNGTASTLAPPVGTAAWSQALGDKIVWMAAGAQQTATLTLNPPTLGPLQIVLNLANDQASANFFTAQPEVRQALETAFPRLREMMSEAGIQLGHASVSAEMPRQHAAPERQAQWTAMPLRETDDAADSPAAAIPRQAGRGLVDTFA